MYARINASAPELVAEARLASAVARYSELVDKFRTTDVASDLAYQTAYRRFWALNAARVSPEWTTRYFQLLQRLKCQPEPDLRAVVRELSATVAGRGSLQFSFATKLVHMLDHTRPVYDSLIASFYFFVPPNAQRPFERRVHELMSFYSFLQGEYERAMTTDSLGVAIRCFHAAFPVASAFTDTKVIDFLLWTYVRMLRGGAQYESRLLYEQVIPC